MIGLFLSIWERTFEGYLNSPPPTVGSSTPTYYILGF